MQQQYPNPHALAYSLKAAAQLLGISESTLRRRVAAGDLPIVKQGRQHIRITRSDLLAYLDTRRK